ncbi:MAG: PHB depolymerase family esterase [Sphingomicrobium sp.]
MGVDVIRNLQDTLARLSKFKQAAQAGVPIPHRLQPLGAFGSNPGALSARHYVPESYRSGGPLVVVLHGCTQTAGGYDQSSGWSRLADRYGFALLFPEQQRSNNPNLCFNWFSADDANRGMGEALSIRQMVAAMQKMHGTGLRRTFVTGLSAGGAMTAVMLATYPDVFAGGAVIAGLPFGVAKSIPEAFDRMRGHGMPRPADLSDLVRRASPHQGEWPLLSVWHGTQDGTVDSSNATALVEQWRSLHGAPKQPSRTDIVAGYPHRVWQDRAGKDVVEEYRLTGLGHGTPLDTSERGAQEVAAPYMLEAGISSTLRIAAFWGIIPALAVGEDEPIARVPNTEKSAVPNFRDLIHSGVTKTIDDALRSAGLLR